jgi:hypothetical protein
MVAGICGHREEPMKTLLAVAALTLLGATPAFAFDQSITDIISRLKANKPMNTTDVSQLMSSSERWCYYEEDGSCSWSDIYLDVTEAGALYEIGNAWDADIDLIFTDTGVFKDGRYICETGVNWVPTLRANRRSDGSPIGGRALYDIKLEVEANNADAVIDCFDYTFVSSDAAAQTVTLMQRQYTDDAYLPDRDAPVTIHFDPETAAALTWRP